MVQRERNKSGGSRCKTLSGIILEPFYGPLLFRLKRKVIKQLYLTSRKMFKSSKKAASIQEQGEEATDGEEGEKKPLITRQLRTLASLSPSLSFSLSPSLPPSLPSLSLSLSLSLFCTHMYIHGKSPTLSDAPNYSHRRECPKEVCQGVADAPSYPITRRRRGCCGSH